MRPRLVWKEAGVPVVFAEVVFPVEVAALAPSRVVVLCCSKTVSIKEVGAGEQVVREAAEEALYATW